MVVALNFTPVPRQEYRVGVPLEGSYKELFNSDSGYYGGSDIGNSGQIITRPESCNGRPYCLPLTLPPLAGVVLRWQGD